MIRDAAGGRQKFEPIDATPPLLKHRPMTILRPRPSRIQLQRTRRTRLALMVLFVGIAFVIAVVKM